MPTSLTPNVPTARHLDFWNPTPQALVSPYISIAMYKQILIVKCVPSATRGDNFFSLPLYRSTLSVKLSLQNKEPNAFGPRLSPYMCQLIWMDCGLETFLTDSEEWRYFIWSMRNLPWIYSDSPLSCDRLTHCRQLSGVHYIYCTCKPRSMEKVNQKWWHHFSSWARLLTHFWHFMYT